MSEVKPPLHPGKPTADDNKPEKEFTIKEAISKYEDEYVSAEKKIKEIERELFLTKEKLHSAEREALIALRNLTPLQNKYLMAVVESQKKQIETLQG